jgi:radical SAM protein with 4Fe4S-binding SPASM domain
MTYEEARDVVHFVAQNAQIQGDKPSINYFGGEPTLMWDSIIVPLTKYIREVYGKGYSISMTSNGILLDEEKLEWMKKNDVGLLFSIDGDKSTQDLNRPLQSGGSSFEILKDRIPIILKYFPNMTFRATIDHDNAQNMLHNFEFALSQGYNNVFMIPNVFVDWFEEEVQALQDGVGLIADIELMRLRKGQRIALNPLAETFSKIKRINQAEEANAFRDQAKNHPAFGRCGMGANRFASVGPGGVLYSCQELVGNDNHGKEFIIGNIYTGVDEQKRRDIINRFDPRNVISTSGKTCKDCKLNRICEGGCVINNYFATGNLNVMPEIMCIWNQTLLEEAIRITNIMGAEKNEFFKRTYMR